MTLGWPLGLALMLLLPIGIALDRLIARRRRRVLASFVAPLAGAAAEAPRRRPARRLVPPAIVVAGFGILLFGLARPEVSLSAPRLEGTVILAFDVSASMGATDYAPTRMAAAKAAAKAFVERQPDTVQVGVVAFSDSGITVQPATSDQALVLAAIDRLTPQRGTSLGSGILAALRAVDAAEHPNQGYYTNRTPDPSPAPVPAGSHTSAIVVLLSDGENNTGPDLGAATRAAADRGIRVETVGIGTPGGTTIRVEGFTLQTALDAATLQRIADATKATYVGAPDAASLDAVYANLDASLLVTAARPTEVTALFAVAGLALLLLGVLTSLAWLGRAP
ncbi:MAG TPA: VWA domain-containing protein [Candidatus Limnocylindrales bacterium]|nr:VWA domain-containing protein [Candidatus Limnocylindrales bacterium]